VKTPIPAHVQAQLDTALHALLGVTHDHQCRQVLDPLDLAEIGHARDVVAVLTSAGVLEAARDRGCTLARIGTHTVSPNTVYAWINDPTSPSGSMRLEGFSYPISVSGVADKYGIGPGQRGRPRGPQA